MSITWLAPPLTESEPRGRSAEASRRPDSPGASARAWSLEAPIHPPGKRSRLLPLNEMKRL